jgi:hypothetical protein
MLHCAETKPRKLRPKIPSGEFPMLVAKKNLTAEDMQSQTAIQLPPRQMLALVNVIVNNVANNLRISIPIQNNHVGVQVCAVVSALNSILVAPDQLTCTLGV